MPRTTRVGPVPMTRKQCAQAAILARLMAENWSDMTVAANGSSNHVGNLERWRKLAREANPALDDVQIDRLAERLKTGYYSRIGQLSGAARRSARARADVA